MSPHILRAAAAAVFAGCLSAGLPAQTFETLASESFEYAPGTPIHDAAGGTGFVAPWWSYDAVNSGSIVTTPGFDAVGEKATTVLDSAGAWRTLDVGPHLALTDDQWPGFTGRPLYGADNTVLWVSFTAQRVPGGDDEWGGLSLYIFFGGEFMFLGSPFGTYEWGFGVPGLTSGTVPGSSVDVATRLVYRFEFLPGDERMQLWLDPPVDHPDPGVTPPDLEFFIPDFRFDEIRIDSGADGLGLAVGYDFDDIRIESEISGPEYTITNLIAGQIATFTVTNATPGNFVVIGYSTAGPGPTSTQFGDVMMSMPISTFPALPADATGTVTLTQFVPANLAGVQVWSQALELFAGGGGILSNPLAEVIQ